jgi:Tol biopolymer transport system component
MPSAGGEPREFPIPTLLAMYDVRWFGDGNGLGFPAYDVRGAITIFRLTLATGEWTTFPLPVSNMTRIEWNTDGSRVFYARGDFGPDDPAIVERDLQSDRERVVFRGSADGFDRYRGLLVSPDRRLLAFRGMSDQQRIIVLDLGTGQPRVVHDKAADDTYTYTAVDSLAVPTWSPNGRALLVNRTENPRTKNQATVLRLIPIDGGAVRQIPLGTELTRLLSSGRGAQGPTMRDLAWSPAGDKLAFVLSAETMETFVLENPLAPAGAQDARASR